jgi:hypothetical protein
MKRIALLAPLLLAPGLALAQPELRSGREAPAASSQLPPSSPSGNSYPGPRGPVPQPEPERQRSFNDDESGAPARTAPPADHQVLGGPPVPGARLPDRSSDGAATRDVIPPNIGDLNRPEATTTGRDTR